MTDKKTFPGAMNAEQRAAFARQQAEQQRAAENAKKLAAEKAEAIRIAKKMKLEAAQRRNDLINKFAKTNLKGNMKAFVLACAVFNIAAGTVDHILADQAPYDNDMTMTVKHRHAIREAYDPYFHAADFWSEDSKPYRNSTVNNRFKRHMILLGIEAFIATCILIGHAGKRYSVGKDVDIMLLAQEIGARYLTDKKIIQRMLNVAPEIVSHMSSESSVYFELLMDGSFDCDKNPRVFAFAKSVLAGHLHSHPEDMKRVLEVFDEASLPQSLVAEYKQNVR